MPNMPESLAQPERAAAKRLTNWWGDRIAALLRSQLGEEGWGVVLNLASQEYFAAVAGKLAGVRMARVS